MKKIFKLSLVATVIGLLIIIPNIKFKATEEDYELSFELYEVTTNPRSFVEEEYNTNKAKLISNNGEVEPGKTYALGVKVKVNNATARIIDTYVNWDDSVLEACAECNKNNNASYNYFISGLPPATEEEIDFQIEWRIFSTFSRGDYYSIENGNDIPQLITTIYNADGYNETYFDKNIVLYWVFFDVKEDVIPGTKFEFNFDNETRIGTINDYKSHSVKTTTSNYKVKEKLRSNVYLINRNDNEDYVEKIDTYIQVSTFISNFQYDEGTLKVYDIDNNLKNNTDIVGTGDMLVLKDDEIELDRLRIIVAGDIDGDGYITIADTGRINDKAKKYSELENYYELIAADTNRDGFISYLDVDICYNFLYFNIDSIFDVIEY